MELFRRLTVPKVRCNYNTTIPNYEITEPYTGRIFYQSPLSIWTTIFATITELRDVINFLQTCKMALTIILDSVTELRHVGKNDPTMSSLLLISSFTRLRKLKINTASPWSPNTITIIPVLAGMIKLQHLTIRFPNSVNYRDNNLALASVKSWYQTSKVVTGLLTIPGVILKRGHLKHGNVRILSPYLPLITLQLRITDYRIIEVEQLINNKELQGLWWSGDLKLMSDMISRYQPPLKYLSIDTPISRNQRFNVVPYILSHVDYLPLEVLDIPIMAPALDIMVTKFPLLKIIGVANGTGVKIIENLLAKHRNIVYVIVYDLTLLRTKASIVTRARILYRHQQHRRFYRFLDIKDNFME